jgi:FkbM family methyltransferase
MLRRVARLRLLRRLVLPGLVESLSDRDLTIQHGHGRGLKFRSGPANWPGYAAGTTEPLVQEALAMYLHQGAVFYDVGANVGFFTLIGARLVRPNGYVRAFEPHPDNAAVLEHNIEINGLRNVELIRAAVGAETGTAKLAGETPLTLHLSAQGIDVPLVTLDELAENLPPTLIKIDVEGAELDVLEGAKDTLARDRPVVVCEVHDTAEQCAALLTAAGYVVTELERDAGGLPHLLGLPLKRA